MTDRTPSRGRPQPPASAPDSDAPGLPARRLAATVIDEVLRARVALDETLDRLLLDSGLEAADAGLVRAIAVTAFRRLGTIRRALDERLDRGSPRHSGLFEPILTAAAAQILFLDVPDHAAVDLAIRHLHADPRSARYAALGNALLRRVVRERDAILAEAGADPFRDTPDWLAASWRAAYGEEAATAIALSHREEPPLDITAKADPALWAEKLGGILLPTGSIRLRERQAIATLPGFEDGAWWVQDAAAALPVKLIAPAPGERIADLCAAPGGKTAQLAALGAYVTAVDRSGARLQRLQENLARLKLSAEVVEADATQFRAEPFDAVLLDAPCTATGTLRRHPDIALAKGPGDIATLAELQGRLLAHGADLVKVGGTLVYSTCSLEPEEGEEQVARFLAARPDFARAPLPPDEIAGLAPFITPQGDVRTLPHDWMRGEAERSGLDGFFAARLRRIG